MGGNVSVNAPVSERVAAVLKDKYENYHGRGCSDDEIQGILDEKLPSIMCFDQVDLDHSGSVDMAELKRFLSKLPRKKPVAPPGVETPKFVPFEKLVATLDSDGDGKITLKEWLENLSNLPGLEMAIHRAVGDDGRVAGSVSLEEELATLQERAANGASRDGDKEEIERLTGVVGTVGLTVFRQIDADGSGKIDRKELLAAVKHLNKYTPEEKLDIAEILKILDRDNDALIDEWEWVAQLYLVPRLRSTIEATIDPETGRIKGFLEEEYRAKIKKARSEWANSAHELLAEIDADAKADAREAPPGEKAAYDAAPAPAEEKADLEAK